jgi:hypothetical protein
LLGNSCFSKLLSDIVSVMVDLPIINRFRTFPALILKLHVLRYFPF